MRGGHLTMTQAIPATISKLSTMADRGIRVQIDTQELTPEYGALLFSLKDSFGYFTFTERPIEADEVEVPEYVPDFKNEKSPSQRLRAVLYLMWQNTDKKISSEQFYREQMDKIIEHYKGKLD
jgi:hypothetical protein